MISDLSSLQRFGSLPMEIPVKNCLEKSFLPPGKLFGRKVWADFEGSSPPPGGAMGRKWGGHFRPPGPILGWVMLQSGAKVFTTLAQSFLLGPLYLLPNISQCVTLAVWIIVVRTYTEWKPVKYHQKRSTHFFSIPHPSWVISQSWHQRPWNIFWSLCHGRSNAPSSRGQLLRVPEL